MCPDNLNIGAVVNVQRVRRRLQIFRLTYVLSDTANLRTDANAVISTISYHFQLLLNRLMFSDRYSKLGQVQQRSHREQPLGIAGDLFFYKPDVLPVIQPTPSKH